MKQSPTDRLTRWLVASLVTIGILARIAPLFDHGGRLMRQFPTEDGYFMLTIGRNLALGHGMTVSAGEIITNGTQPLATLLWSLAFQLSQGNREIGVALVLLLEIVIAAATAAMMVRLGRRCLLPGPESSGAIMLAASAWFASPVVLPHTMNCLETGLYGFFVALSLDRFLALDTRWRPGAVAGFGAILGLTFWARNDAVFLILGICLAHCGFGASLSGRDRWRAFGQAFLFGAVSVVMALPWLVFNYVTFGDIVPISGQSEAMGASLADNLHLVPVVLFEYASLIVPIPHTLEASPAVVGFAALVCAAYLPVTLIRSWKVSDPRGRKLIAAGCIYALCISGYYGLTFGAGWFVNRYLFPLSIPMALLWAATVGRSWTKRTWGRGLSGTVAMGALAAIIALHVRAYIDGARHPHFQVVEWVATNVPSSTWVGAPQAGTLGFFHDRTINLDGKVNPDALRARREERLLEYVVASPIDFIVDWEGMAGWIDEPVLAPHFELVVHDPARNLAVLRRTMPRDPAVRP